MRRLIIMRHAKSDWSGGQTDHDRPLNARGRGAAPTIARQLLKRDWVPLYVACSDAERTTETWLLMANLLPSATQTHFEPALYLAEPETILRVVSAFADSHHTAMTLAHNPGSSDLVGLLTGQFVGLKTANAVLLEAKVDSWSAAARCRDWHVVAVLQPD